MATLTSSAVYSPGVWLTILTIVTFVKIVGPCPISDFVSFTYIIMYYIRRWIA